MRAFKNILLISFVLFLALAALATTASAAFLIIDEHGNLVWQVLSRGSNDNDEEEEGEGEFRVEVKTQEERPGRETRTEVKIRTEDGRIKLRVGTPSGETEMDVGDLRGDIIRVRERTEEGEIRIRARGDRLEIRQKGVGALTNFPISVNPGTNELTVTTPSGIRIVTILPSVAVANILQSNIMDRVLAAQAGVSPSPQPPETPEPEDEEGEEATEAAELEEEVEFSGVIESIIGNQWVIGGRAVIISTQTELDEELSPGVLARVEGVAQPDGSILAEEIETDQEIELVEEDGQLSFKIRGVKDVRFLNLLSFETPITALVSVQTGETLQVSRPWFLTLFGFLFAQ